MTGQEPGDLRLQGARRHAASTAATALTLAVGATGGWLGDRAGLPLAWLLGAVFVVTPLALAGLRPVVPHRFRQGWLPVLGVALGATFTPEVAGQAVTWWASVLGMVAYVVLSAVAAVAVLRRVRSLDPITAFFSAMPGGLSTMVLAGAEAGGEQSTIALIHAVRILIVVVTIPFAFTVFGTDTGSITPAAVSPPPLPGASGMAVLVACGALGVVLARRTGLPVPLMIGPMLLTAVVHLAGLSAAQPPSTLVAAAQVVIGAAIGAQFVGVPLRRFRQMLMLAAAVTAVLMAVGAAATAGLAVLTGLPVGGLILAFAPGGIAEMSLIALAMGGDVAFVVTHHIVRLAAIGILGPLVFRVVQRRAPHLIGLERRPVPRA